MWNTKQTEGFTVDSETDSSFHYNDTLLETEG